MEFETFRERTRSTYGAREALRFTAGMQGSENQTPWWTRLYDEWLAESLLVRTDPTETSKTIAFLVDALGIEPGARVFDQCCGIGSLAVPLASLGYDVLGVDQADAYIERGRKSARDAAVHARFEQGDAFEFVADPPCHAAINWWTSYGYAATSEDNLQMLARARESLVPGGRFALDVPHLPGILRSFEDDRTDVRETPLGRIEMRRISRFDLTAGRLIKEWTFHVDGALKSDCVTSIQLALASDHIAALETAGFRVLHAWSDIDRSPLTIDSPRCILIAEVTP